MHIIPQKDTNLTRNICPRKGTNPARIRLETLFREKARIRREKLIWTHMKTEAAYTLLINIGSTGFRSARRVRDCSGILWRRRRRRRRWRRRQRYSGKPDGSAGTPRKKRNPESQNLRRTAGHPRFFHPRKGTNPARKGFSTKRHESDTNGYMATEISTPY